MKRNLLAAAISCVLLMGLVGCATIINYPKALLLLQQLRLVHPHLQVQITRKLKTPAQTALLAKR